MRKWMDRRSSFMAYLGVLGVGLALLAQLSSASAEMGDSEISDFNPTVDERVVQNGDTLWDIAEEVLGDPLLWPKVWSMNPEISNPHWIYPGDIIRFYRPSLMEPSLYGSMNAARVVSGGEETIVVGEASIEEDQEQEAERTPGVEIINTLPVEVVHFGGRNRDKGIFSGLFVSPKKMKTAGKMSNASPDRELLTVSDKVFVALEQPALTKPGDSFMTFKELGEVRHPSSGDFTGYLNVVTGKLVVLEIKDGIAKGRVSKIYGDMSRGQLVTPFVREPFTKIAPNAGPTQVIRGEIIVIQSQDRRVGGQHSLIIVDRGSKDGVQPGNRFAVWGEKDPTVQGVEDSIGPLAREPQSGELLVLDVQANTATCTTTKSMRELHVGNKVSSIGKAILPTRQALDLR